MADVVGAFNHILQAAATGVGNGTAMNVGGLAGVGVQVEGITNATVTFQATLDGATFYAIEAWNLNNGTKATSTAADGLFLVPLGGAADELRCRIDPYVGGTITVTGKGVVNPAAATLADVTLAANSGVDIGEVDVLSIAAGETHIGEVGGNTPLVDVILTLDAGNIYAAGDVLAATQEVADAMRIDGGTGILTSLVLIDIDDQGQPLDLVFFQETATLGTENDPISISDADAVKQLGVVHVLAADYDDMINSQSATIRNIGLELTSAADSRSIFLAAISQGTGTHSASGITVRLGISWD